MGGEGFLPSRCSIRANAHKRLNRAFLFCSDPFISENQAVSSSRLFSCFGFAFDFPKILCVLCSSALKVCQSQLPLYCLLPRISSSFACCSGLSRFLR